MEPTEVIVWGSSSYLLGTAHDKLDWGRTLVRYCCCCFVDVDVTRTASGHMLVLLLFPHDTDLLSLFSSLLLSVCVSCEWGVQHSFVNPPIPTELILLHIIIIIGSYRYLELRLVVYLLVCTTHDSCCVHRHQHHRTWERAVSISTTADLSLTLCSPFLFFFVDWYAKHSLTVKHWQQQQQTIMQPEQASHLSFFKPLGKPPFLRSCFNNNNKILYYTLSPTSGNHPEHLVLWLLVSLFPTFWSLFFSFFSPPFFDPTISEPKSSLFPAFFVLTFHNPRLPLSSCGDGGSPKKG